MTEAWTVHGFRDCPRVGWTFIGDDPTVRDMQRSVRRLISLSVIALAILTARAQGSAAFTYQGRLLDGGTPATGIYDFDFSIFDASVGGQQIAGPLVLAATPVDNGLFTVVLDFGIPFPGGGRWLEIGVRPNGTEVFTILGVRQELTSAPYAISAASVDAAAITSEMLAPGAVTTEKIAPGAVGGEQIDDEGRAAYEEFVDSAEALGASDALSFAQLSPVLDAGGPASTFTLRIEDATFGTVVGFVGSEGFSQPPVYLVQVRTFEMLVDPGAQIGLPAILTFARNGRRTDFEGVVTAMTLALESRAVPLYTVRIESPLVYLALNTDYRVSQSMTTPDEVARRYTERTSETPVSNLSATYEIHENRIQYGETDLNFLSRLLEHEGVFYFFDPGSSPPSLVLGDEPGAYLSGGGLTLTYYGDTGSGIPEGEEYIRTFRKGQALATLQTTVDTYQFEDPSASLASTRSGSSGVGEHYEYGAGLATGPHITHLAQVRQERHEVERAVISGTGTASGLRAGVVFTLEDAAGVGLKDDYVVTSVRHAGFVQLVKEVPTLHYANHFEVIPATQVYRPPLATRRPQALPITAVVTGPAGETIYVDEHGRVKVHFHWDRYGAKDENSSAWLRVASPMAGRSHGMMFLPQIGDEVLVTFVQGDPDRPVIVGSLYNSYARPPYALPDNKTRSTIRSSGLSGQVNEIRFDDQAGSEELMVKAAKDMNVSVANDASVIIDHDASLNLGNNASVSVGNDVVMNVGGELTFASSQASIGGPLSLSGPVALGGPLSVSGTLAAGGPVSIGGGTAFGKVQAGQGSIGSSTKQVVSVKVTFPEPFSAVPKVVVTVVGDSRQTLAETFVASLRAVGASSFEVNVMRVDAVGGWTQTLRLNWLAWQ